LFKQKSPSSHVVKLLILLKQ